MKIKIKTQTDQKVEASIVKSLKNSNPPASDYYNAATYYLTNNKDIKKTKIWIDKAVDKTKEKPNFKYIYHKALIYKLSGYKKQAKKIAILSLKLAKKAKHTRYINLNKDLLKNL